MIILIHILLPQGISYLIKILTLTFKLKDKALMINQSIDPKKIRLNWFLMISPILKILTQIQLVPIILLKKYLSQS
jgi:hypothetical protein